MKKSLNKAVLLALCVFILSLLCLLTFRQTQSSSQYKLLSSNIKKSELEDVFSALKEKKIHYRFEGPRAVLLIKKSQFILSQQVLNHLRNKKKKAQNTKSIFSKPYFGLISSHVQKLKYQKELQEDLAQAINRFHFIKSSQVILTKPQKKYWYKNKKNHSPSATIILDVHEGVLLTAKQVQSIVFLVASSMKTLNPNRVMVLNSQGDVLSSENLKFTKSVNKLKKEFQKKKLTLPLLKPKISSLSQPIAPKKKLILSPLWFSSLAILLSVLGFVLGWFLCNLRASQVKSVDMALPRTVEELEEWHSETFQVSQDREN